MANQTKPRRNTLRRGTLRAGVLLCAASAAFACSSAPTEQHPSAASLASAPAPSTAVRQQLNGHLKPALRNAPVVGGVPASTPIKLTIGLPVKNQAELDAELEQISDPRSPHFRHYLTSQQFADKYGARPEDYDALVAWAKSMYLEVTTHADRLLVSVRGAAADVERALHLNLVYALRPDGTRFYEPDVEPSLDLDVPVRHVSHLDDYEIPRAAAEGVNPVGSYLGQDLRNAYTPGTSFTGQGQTIGILADENLFSPNDILAFNVRAGINPPPVQIVGTPGTQTAQQIEVTLDIDAAQSMAPAAQIVVFNGSTDEILAAMADHPEINQFTSSFYPSFDTNSLTALQKLQAVGQSFLNCSGDNGAFIPNTWTGTADVRNQNGVTVVGGTILTLNGAAYSGEQAWSSPCNAGTCGTSGGIESNPTGGTLIPSYQVGLANTANQASSKYRNLPDVAAIAYNFDIDLNSSWQSVGGTSVAAPTWAGFLALVNEQAQAFGQPTVGFANPALYALAASPASYANDFHDVQSGSNPATSNTAIFYNATPGYDLTTGLGSPAAPLVVALAARNTPQAPRCTFSASQTSPGTVYDGCTTNAAGDPIYIFDQSASGSWSLFSYYPGSMPSIGSGATETFLGCSWRAADFASQSAWFSAVGPGLVGCDTTPATVTTPSCVPLTCETGMCGTMSNGCGGTLTCSTACGTGLVCNAHNQCAKCSVTSCPAGTVLNESECVCVSKVEICICGGTYPACQRCE